MKNILRFLTASLCVFYHTNLLHSQWVQINDSVSSVYTFAVSDTNIFAGTSLGVFLSTDYGNSWRAVNSGLPGNPLYPTYPIVNALAVSPASGGAGSTNLFAAVVNAGVFLSTNNGTSWNAINTGLPHPQYGIFALAIIGNYLFAGTDEDGVYRSTNNGMSWSAASSGLPTYPNASSHFVEIVAVAVSGTSLFASAEQHGNFLSTNLGTSWIEVDSGLPIDQDAGNSYPTNASCFAVSGTNLFAGINTLVGGGEVFISTNDGVNWKAASRVSYENVSVFALSDTNLFAGTQLGGVFLSTNNGTSWTAVNVGWTNANVTSLAVSGGYLLSGNGETTFPSAGGIWRRPLSEMITSVPRLPSDVPMHYSLHQNYPNPFNPSTTISFDLPSRSSVSLKVYDILGKEVSTVVSEELQAGTYTRQWNASGFASGVYFYRLQAGQYNNTMKLLFLK